jgi:hypothetical protein
MWPSRLFIHLPRTGEHTVSDAEQRNTRLRQPPPVMPAIMVACACQAGTRVVLTSAVLQPRELVGGEEVDLDEAPGPGASDERAMLNTDRCMGVLAGQCFRAVCVDGRLHELTK